MEKKEKMVHVRLKPPAVEALRTIMRLTGERQSVIINRLLREAEPNHRIMRVVRHA